MASLAKNWESIRTRIQSAAEKSGRKSSAITVVAVSKFQSVERIQEAVETGLVAFGESRLQEALEKMPQLQGPLEWHFIGTLQRNKARAVAEHFQVIHSVDSVSLAQKLSESAVSQGRTLRIFAQVNISHEPQKHGFSMQSEDDVILRLGQLPGLKLEGLMGMGTASEDPEASRPLFASLARMAQRLGVPLKLSMGMSRDFEVAIEEGADMVRIGTVLFS